MNKIELAKSIALMLGDLIVDGVMDTSDPTPGLFFDVGHLAFTLESQPVGKMVYIHEGIGAGQQGHISAYTTGSNGLTIIPSFSVAPSLNSKYYIFDRYTWSDYSEAIDSAVRRARRLSLIDMTATLALVATQWAYAVPSGLRFVDSLTLVPSGSTDYTNTTRGLLHRNTWGIKPNPVGTYLIHFDPMFINLDDHDNKLIQVGGQRRPTLLSAPTTDSEVPDEYVIDIAKIELLLIRETDPQERFTLRRERTLLERKMFSHRRASAVEVGL